MREYWDDYLDAYEETIRHTATNYAPWVVVPADDKKLARVIVAAAVVDALEELDLEFPKVDARQRQQLDHARVVLSGKGGGIVKKADRER